MRSDRWSGRVEPPNRNSLLRPGASAYSANDSLGRNSATSGRITAQRAQALCTRLSGSELRVIETLSHVRIATGGQLRRLHWADSETGRRLARRHLARLAKLRVVARLNRRIGGQRAGSDGYTYVLDVAGQRIAERFHGRARRPTTPGAGFVDHSLAITECYVCLRQQENPAKFELVAYQGEPDCWRSYSTGPHRRAVLKPDAFAITQTPEFEDRWFIEVDRDTEHPARISRKGQQYVEHWRSGTEQHEHQIYPRVLWVAPSSARAEQLVEALSHLGPDSWQLFQVCTMSDLPSVLAPPP